MKELIKELMKWGWWSHRGRVSRGPSQPPPDPLPSWGRHGTSFSLALSESGSLEKKERKKRVSTE